MKKIIVTGCSSGIGFYLAESLSKSDYKVIGLARNEPKEKCNFEFQDIILSDIQMNGTLHDHIATIDSAFMSINGQRIK